MAPQNNPYGGGSLEFFKLMKRWRKNGKLEGLETHTNSQNKIKEA
jgi:hypothetical protein